MIYTRVGRPHGGKGGGATIGVESFPSLACPFPSVFVTFPGKVCARLTLRITRAWPTVPLLDGELERLDDPLLLSVETLTSVDASDSSDPLVNGEFGLSFDGLSVSSEQRGVASSSLSIPFAYGCLCNPLPTIDRMGIGRIPGSVPFGREEERAGAEAAVLRPDSVPEGAVVGAAPSATTFS